MPYGWARKRAKEQEKEPAEEQEEYDAVFNEWIGAQADRTASYLLEAMDPSDDEDFRVFQMRQARVLGGLLIAANFLQQAARDSHQHVDGLVALPHVEESHASIAGAALFHGQIDSANFLMFKLLRQFSDDMPVGEFSRRFDELLRAQVTD